MLLTSLNVSTNIMMPRIPGMLTNSCHMLYCCHSHFIQMPQPFKWVHRYMLIGVKLGDHMGTKPVNVVIYFDLGNESWMLQKLLEEALKHKYTHMIHSHTKRR